HFELSEHLCSFFSAIWSLVSFSQPRPAWYMHLESFYLMGGRCCQFTICSDASFASQGRPHDRRAGSANHSAPRSTSLFSERSSFAPRRETRRHHLLFRRSVGE